MKGIILNLLEDAVVDAYGESAWDRALDEAELDGVYTSLGNYDDADLMKLVSVVGTALAAPDDDVLRWFGQQAIPGMVKRWPGFFAPHQQTVPFLKTLNSVIHPEVRKLYAGASCPHFAFTSVTDGSLVIGYRSPRKLCGLAHGFILGAGDHYGETLAVRHQECRNEGSDRCLIAVTPP